MLVGELPWEDGLESENEPNMTLLYNNIVNIPPAFPMYMNPVAQRLLRRLLVVDPSKRASLPEVAHHGWLNEYADVV
jgi:serine/threonine protein kinase